MESISEQSAPIMSRSDNTVKKAGEALDSEAFLLRIQGIWNKVALLENLGVIRNDEDKFDYAYRFAEIELQKSFIENIFLRDGLNALST